MMLTHAAYDAMGGLHGAIADRAEVAIGVFLPGGEDALRRLFLQLVQPGVGTLDTRRRMAVGELGDLDGRIVAALVEARLLVAGLDPLSREQTLEIAHEALIRSWRRLRDWVAADRELLMWRQRVGAARAAWLHAGRDGGALLRGASLIEAEQWLETRGADLTGEEREFVAVGAQERVREEGVARRQRRRLILQLAAGLAVFAVLAAVASGFAFQQKAKADRQRADAIAAFGEADASRAAAADAATELSTARQETDQLEQQIGDAQAAKTAAEQQRDKTLADAKGALDALDAAQQSIDEAQAEQAAAEARLADTEQARADAQAQAELAQAERSAAQAAQQDAETKAQTAQTALQTTRTNINAVCPAMEDLSGQLLQGGVDLTALLVTIAAKCG